MESFVSRYRNVVLLVGVLFAQVIGLATQIRRAKDPANPRSESAPLLRIWVVTLITPLERAAIYTGSGLRNAWHSYVDLHEVRHKNQQLQQELDRLRIEQVRLQEDAAQARRLQLLLGFKEQYIRQTLAAQVVGTSGSDLSRILYIDKGWADGVKNDMPVITPSGVVGKIKDVLSHTAQVLEINDISSGAGVLLEKSRLRGVLRGSVSGRPEIVHVMADEKVDIGERVITSGGDLVYPPGLPVGVVQQVYPDRDNDPFLTIRVKPFADLNRLEEVLVITEVQQRTPEVAQSPRAADILAERLPSVKLKPSPPSPQKPVAAPAKSNSVRVAQSNEALSQAEDENKDTDAARTATTSPPAANRPAQQPKINPPPVPKQGIADRNNPEQRPQETVPR